METPLVIISQDNKRLFDKLKRLREHLQALVDKPLIDRRSTTF